jgi:hypothetical protein
MERSNPPVERRAFRDKADEDEYVARARGFGSVTEMRDHFAANPLGGRRSVETSDSEFDDDLYRRLIVVKRGMTNE